MSIPPPTGSSAPPGGAGSLQEHVLALDVGRSWKRRRSGEPALRLSVLGATLEHLDILHAPLKLPLGMLRLGAVERGFGAAEGQFAILRRLSATTVVPREHGIEGWLWTRAGGSALTMLGDEDEAPNAALLFTKPLGEELAASAFEADALEEIAARSPLGVPAVHGFVFRVVDRTKAETTFRRFGLLRPLTDRDVPPTLRRSLPTDRPADPRLNDFDAARTATSVAPPGLV